MSRKFLLLFPFLSLLAVNFMFRHIYHSNLHEKLDFLCASPTSKFNRPYTAIQALDRNAICGLIAFFHVLIQSPSPLPIIPYFIGTGLPYVLLTILNSYTRTKSSVLLYSTLWLLLTQFASFGATYPIYSLFLVLSSSGNLSQLLRAITRANAESLAFALLVGGCIPSIAMLYMHHPYITWIWQLYPVLIFIARHLYLLLCPPSHHLQSGYSVMRTVYIASLMVSFLTHLSVIIPRIWEFSALRSLLIPSTASLGPSTDIRLLALHFLKWDLFLGYTAAALSTLWFAQSPKQVILMTLWYVGATPFIGMGSSVMAFVMWRDGILKTKDAVHSH